MKRIVLIDGIEATGKTTLVNMILEREKNYGYIKCPSKEIICKWINNMKSIEFDDVKQYIDAYMLDIYNRLKKEKNNIIVFDRGQLSTLAYQGKTLKTRSYINSSYSSLYTALDIDERNSIAILMLDPIIGKSRVEKIEEKKILAKEYNLCSKFKYATSLVNFPVKNFNWNIESENEILSLVCEM